MPLVVCCVFIHAHWAPSIVYPGLKIDPHNLHMDVKEESEQQERARWVYETSGLRPKHLFSPLKPADRGQRRHATVSDAVSEQHERRNEKKRIKRGEI